VELPKQNVIGTKWVFRNKQGEHGVVTRNKAMLVAQGFTEIKCLDYECLKDFLLKNCFEMGKTDSTLFTHKINNDIFVCQI